MKEINDKTDFSKRTIKTWDALYWDAPAGKTDSTKDKKLDPNYDFDNPLAKCVDSDGDGLSNYNSTNGFTVIGSYHRPWRKEYENHSAYKGYPKYTCSYNKVSTAGDPYTDLQKALGNVSNLLPITRNPLVAACPCVSAQMEGYSISQLKDITISDENGFHSTTSNRSTVSHTKENSVSKETSESLGGGIGISGELPTVQGSGQLGWSKNISDGRSNTNSVESSSDSTNTSAHTFQQHWNTADYAYFNAYVRYVNTGTASMLKAKPALNFGVYDKNIGDVSPVATVAPVENSAAEVLNLEGDSFYPSPELMPIVIQTKDSFNAQRITLSKEQFESIVAGNPMRLDVPQVKGEFQGKINATKDPFVPNVNKNFEWANFLPHINDNTARLTLITPDGKIYDRRIAAPKFSEDKSINELGNGVKNRLDLYADIDKVPLLNIGQAIQIAFGKNQNSFVLDHDIKYSLHRADVNLILDEHTNQILKKTVCG
ncbi:binary toxin-like calcium binding domain-containing protein [Bacillus cereus]